MNLVARTLVIAAFTGAATAALGAGWLGVLNNTAAEVFEEDDLQLLLAAARQALQAEGDAQPVKWTNPASGAGGSFVVTGNSVSPAGLPCRRLRMTVFAKDHPEKATPLEVCKAPDGRWKLTATK